MKLRRKVAQVPHTPSPGRSRYLRLAGDNPLLTRGLVALFLLALVQLVVITPAGVRLPRPGEIAAASFSVRKPVRCRKPNPTFEHQKIEAESSSRSVYRWDRPSPEVWTRRLESAFTVLEASLVRIAEVEREAQMLLAKSSTEAPRGPLVRLSEFYQGGQPGDAPPKDDAAQGPDPAEQQASLKARLQEAAALRDEAWQQFVGSLGIMTFNLDTSRCLRLLSQPSMRAQVLQASLQILEQTRGWLIQESFNPVFKKDRENGIVINDTGELLSPDAWVTSLVEASDTIHATTAESIIGRHFPGILGSPMMRLLVKNIAAGQLRANFARNEQATEEARRRAVEAVPMTLPVVFSPGDTVISRGERAEAWQVQCLEDAQVREESTGDTMAIGGVRVERIVSLLGMALLVAGSVLLPYHFLRSRPRAPRLSRRDVAVASLVILIQAALFYFAALVMVPLRSAFPGLEESVFMVGVPVALSPIVLNVLLGGTAPFLASVIAALLAPLALRTMAPMDFGGNFAPFYMVYVLVSGMVALMTTRRVGSRAALARAGLVVAGAGIAFWMLVYMAHAGTDARGQIQVFLAALVSGLLSYVGAIALVPTFESFFGYLTDMKLMEFVNLNHPALKELYEKARGTYDHSATVAKLAEVAAEAIGANALLAKAGSYFHDLGKLRAKEVAAGRGDADDRGIESPQYFVENQTDGGNPHDHLSPSMSARIIRRHVEKSIEEIRRYRLGREIEDIAQQHHGTTVMQYFHSRALDQARDPSQVSEDDFRYPGPKPQTREAGIVMLADTIEAAVRSIKDPTEARIRARVEQLINM
ncbi:MAG: HDIG domain-containing protein, partial [Deltaproteobacteria bacterium]|nr:HDIG domain-containing protein [Deltaproteobacteria bacterium]